MARVRQARRCRAHRSSDGQPCRCWAVLGARVCRVHGGAAPQVRAAAARRELDRAALAVLAQLARRGIRPRRVPAAGAHVAADALDADGAGVAMPANAEAI